jgi:hypothetical protein
MTRRYYVDTSAYLCVLLGEAKAAALVRTLKGGALLSSTLLPLEADRALVRLSREGGLSPRNFQTARERLASDVELFTLRDLTIDLSLSRAMPVVTTPRSLDLAHLRTALWFHERTPLTSFVSLDEAQLLAARELGLPVGG